MRVVGPIATRTFRHARRSADHPSDRPLFSSLRSREGSVIYSNDDVPGRATSSPLAYVDDLFPRFLVRRRLRPHAVCRRRLAPWGHPPSVESTRTRFVTWFGIPFEVAAKKNPIGTLQRRRTVWDRPCGWLIKRLTQRGTSGASCGEGVEGQTKTADHIRARGQIHTGWLAGLDLRGL